jgi:hypothetical protein
MNEWINRVLLPIGMTFMYCDLVCGIIKVKSILMSYASIAIQNIQLFPFGAYKILWFEMAFLRGFSM